MIITVKPKKEAVLVRKPDGTHLDKKGEKVKRTAFWVRRINDGDVVVEETEQSNTPAKTEEKGDK
ncbi:DUF2635 domain-containing protein [Aliivibrio sp. S4TY2]|uniref:DUF2635 domain-containing protein n=1 Tax=unclassified Aliivibrio TaxID=2645654 RepID=UPI002378C02B|nr:MULTISPECIES: DUF2635 domain-containing protein [unclassified Aliivibrio]MDD9158311.1 DUF2635 domain-containing protein [Aliivibrio sp. S4TY2]MDD9162281.1 DUF2635 domain-containing protein [Aliivibrio sp. S4TY1]MDD9166319.1 DUF2635 domain-containing protein [Aliivibrio sp. S4MY2]MDD9170317.1 DUF2635 domain-containing protein [Aliivibrio sp. S4MY4]MDD9187368.1 DUF2635 domain-containing protein [Aliivibrio sp. S4MY3]